MSSTSLYQFELLGLCALCHGVILLHPQLSCDGEAHPPQLHYVACVSAPPYHGHQNVWVPRRDSHGAGQNHHQRRRREGRHCGELCVLNLGDVGLTTFWLFAE